MMNATLNYYNKNAVTIPFGSRKLYLFSPEDVKKIREENHIEEHNDQTIHKDFFDFLNERDYSLSYKMPFLLSFMKHMDSVGDAKIDAVRGKGVGIPCFVLEDGTVTLTPEEVGLHSKPAEGAACRVDGKGC